MGEAVTEAALRSWLDCDQIDCIYNSLRSSGPMVVWALIQIPSTRPASPQRAVLHRLGVDFYFEYGNRDIQRGVCASCSLDC